MKKKTNIKISQQLLTDIDQKELESFDLNDPVEDALGDDFRSFKMSTPIEELSADDFYLFHKLWYKITQSPQYHIPQEIVNEWKKLALELGKEMLQKMQLIMLKWYIYHDYRSPEKMWEERIVSALEYLNDEQVLDIVTPIINRMEIGYDDFFEEVIANIDIDFAEWYIYYFWGNIAEDSNGDVDEEELEKLYDNQYYLLEKIQEYMNVDPMTRIGEMSATIFSIKQARTPFVRTFTDHTQEFIMWCEGLETKKELNIGLGFEELTDLTGAQIIRNKQTLENPTVENLGAAISLCLNLKHNTGNLIFDHNESGDLTKYVLDDLSNMDMKEEDEELKSIGLRIDDIYEKLERPDYSIEFNEQHPYYREKEMERIKSILERNPDKTLEQLRPIIRPFRGGGIDWRNNLIKIIAEKL